MQNQCRVCCALWVTCCVLSTSGCLARYRTSPVEVTVTGGSSLEPLVGASVRVEYPDRDLLTAPPSPKGITDERGKITLPIAGIETATITVTSAKDAETPFKEQFRLSKKIIRDGGELERKNAMQTASWNGPSSLWLTLENRRWRPALFDRFRKQPPEDSIVQDESETGVGDGSKSAGNQPPEKQQRY